MFNSHLLKVIVGFCGMIAIGLAILLFMNSTKVNSSTSTPSQVKTTNNTKTPSSSVTLPPIQKSSTTKKPIQ